MVALLLQASDMLRVRVGYDSVGTNEENGGGLLEPEESANYNPEPHPAECRCRVLEEVDARPTDTATQDSMAQAEASLLHQTDETRIGLGE